MYVYFKRLSLVQEISPQASYDHDKTGHLQKLLYDSLVVVQHFLGQPAVLKRDNFVFNQAFYVIQSDGHGNTQRTQ